MKVKEKWKNLLPKKTDSVANNSKAEIRTEKPVVENTTINFIQPKLMSISFSSFHSQYSFYFCIANEERKKESVKRKRETTDILGNVLKKTASNVF